MWNAWSRAAVAAIFCWALLEVALAAYFSLGRGPFVHLDELDELDLDAEISHYLSRRHERLGWVPEPTPAGAEDEGLIHFDSTAARLSPAFPTPGDACVSAYGDSFALSADVSDADAWSERRNLSTTLRHPWVRFS